MIKKINWSVVETLVWLFLAALLITGCILILALVL